MLRRLIRCAHAQWIRTRDLSLGLEPEARCGTDFPQSKAELPIPAAETANRGILPAGANPACRILLGASCLLGSSLRWSLRSPLMPNVLSEMDEDATWAMNNDSFFRCLDTLVWFRCSKPAGCWVCLNIRERFWSRRGCWCLLENEDGHGRRGCSFLLTFSNWPRIGTGSTKPGTSWFRIGRNRTLKSMGGFSERRHHLLLKFVLDSNRNRRFGPQKFGRITSSPWRWTKSAGRRAPAIWKSVTPPSIKCCRIWNPSVPESELKGQRRSLSAMLSPRNPAAGWHGDWGAAGGDSRPGARRRLASAARQPAIARNAREPRLSNSAKSHPLSRLQDRA